jgi:hypothetical protein
VLSEVLRQKRFKVTEDIIFNMKHHLQMIPKEYFQKCFYRGMSVRISV